MAVATRSALVCLLGMSSLSGAPAADSAGFKPHIIRQGDGQGGWILKEAQCQILRYRERGWSVGTSVAQMDNGEIILLGHCDVRKSLWYGPGTGQQTIIAFSKDRGDTWTDFKRLVSPRQSVPVGQPNRLADLGGGRLTYTSEERFFSNDYGRTWSHVPMQPCTRGGPPHGEGDPLVDRDQHGKAIRLAEIAYNQQGRPQDAKAFFPGMSFIRWSDDGGRTWKDEVRPANWAASEGALVRAENGWLVAALRTATSATYPGEQGDEYRCTSVSISKDDGRTWSDPRPLLDGRMHANLLRLPNGDLVMTVVCRHDLGRGKLVSYRRGCEAIISHDNGVSWNLDRKYVLDEWQFYDQLAPSFAQSGHLSSTLLDDGSLLTVHNNYLTMGMTLIRWRP